MNCLDCAAARHTTSAVGVCLGCGASLCMAHAVVGARYLTRTGVINRQETVDVPARLIYCQVCAAAAEAEARPAHRRLTFRR